MARTWRQASRKTRMQEIEERVGFAEEAVERGVGTTAWPSHYADDVAYLLRRLREVDPLERLVVGRDEEGE